MLKRFLSKSSLVTALERLPLSIIIFLVGYSIVSVVLLLLGAFHIWLILPIGLFAGGVLIFLTYRHLDLDVAGSKKSRLICDVLVLLGVVAWGCFNVFFTSQHVLTNRDPATYANAASWLSTRSSLDIPASSTYHGVEGVDTRSGGFADRDGVVYAQGQHLLPALLGSAGKIVGDKHVLRLNIIFGMTAILALYAFARLFVRPHWAVLGSAIFASSLPLVYFSRDTYTEPLAATFTLGALTLFWLAQHKMKPMLWLVAGLTMGAGVLVRIDGYLSLVGIAAFLVLFVCCAGSVKLRGLRVRMVGWSMIGAFVMCLVAWFDLVMLSPLYYEDHKRLVMMELAALIGVIAVGVALYLLVKRNAVRLDRINKATIAWRPMAAALVVLIFATIMISRPLWLEDPGTGVQNALVAGIQQYEGSQVEPRNYSEITTDWIAWYVGPVVLLLGFTGLAIAAYRGVLDEKMLLLASVIMVLGTALVYFIKPSITPDQIWASRRMLPLLIPAFVVFAMYALSEIEHYAAGVWNARINGLLIGLVGVILTTPPLLTMRPFVLNHDTVQYSIVEQVCSNLSESSAIVWFGEASYQALQPTRTYCDKEAFGYQIKGNHHPTRESLVAMYDSAKRADKVALVGVYDNEEYIFDTGSKLTNVGRLDFMEIHPSLTRKPDTLRSVGFNVLIGQIMADGTIEPLNLN